MNSNITRISREMDGLTIALQFDTNRITFPDIEKVIREVASIAAVAMATHSDESKETVAEEPEDTKPVKKTATKKAAGKRTTAKAKKAEEPEDDAEDTLELRKQVAEACKTLIGFGSTGKARFKKIDSKYLPDGGKLSDLDESTLNQMLDEITQETKELEEASRKTATKKATGKRTTAKAKKAEEPEEEEVEEPEEPEEEEAEEDEDPVTRKELRELAKEIAASGVKGRREVKAVLSKYTKVGKLVAVPDDKVTDMYNDLCDVYDELFPEDAE